MKTFKIRTFHLLYISIVAVFLSGCVNYGQDYKYTYTAKVTYTDGTIDTLTFEYDSFNGNNVYVALKITDSGFLASGGTSPCLVAGCGFRWTPITCGVRKYELLNEEKTEL